MAYLLVVAPGYIILPFRYKMPRLVAKVEGKGNGVKTVIPNMVDIARSLERPPTCKFSSKLSLKSTVSTVIII